MGYVKVPLPIREVASPQYSVTSLFPVNSMALARLAV